jgi:hypothetical protein
MFMKKIIAVVILFTVLTACNSSSKQNEPENMETAGEWKDLFDGKTTTGWHKYGGGPVGASWQVVDGTLHFDPAGNDGGDIVTDEEFENFHLSLEWKISEKGNSGIIFLVHESPEYKFPWETGPEMQILDNDGHPDGKILKHRAGDLYDLISASPETVQKVGEWNRAEIKVVHGQLDFYLNSVQVVSTTLWDDNWKQMVANSKFKTMPGFGTYKKGRIALQDHGDKVWFRNIRIKVL